MNSSSNKVPYLSIIIPMFNLEDFIIETLISIINQEIKYSYEVIVVDDGSTDNSLHLVREFSSTRTNFHTLNNSRSKGVSGARNTGILYAKGFWISFIDGDDIWLEDNINKKLLLVEDYKGIDLISSGFFYWNYEDGIFDSVRSIDAMRFFFSKYNENKIYFIENPVHCLLENQLLIHTGTVLIKRKLLDSVGIFNEDYEISEDTDLWLRVANKAKNFVYVNEDLMLYRTRNDSLSRPGIPLSIWNVKLFVGLYENPEFSKYKSELASKLSYFFLNNAYYYRKNREYKLAVISSFNSLCYNIFSLQTWKCFLNSLLFR